MNLEIRSSEKNNFFKFGLAIFIIVYIFYSSLPAFARRVQDTDRIYGTFVDIKGRSYNIIVSNSGEFLQVRSETEEGDVAGLVYIDKQALKLEYYFQNKHQSETEIEAGLDMLLFKVIIPEAREEGIFLLEVEIDDTITGLLLERLRDSGYIEKLQFYPEINPKSAYFSIPLTPGVAPVDGEHRIP